MVGQRAALAALGVACVVVVLSGCVTTPGGDTPCSFGYFGSQVRWHSRQVYDALPAAEGSEAFQAYTAALDRYTIPFSDPALESLWGPLAASDVSWVVPNATAGSREVVWLVPQHFVAEGQPVLAEAGAQFRASHTAAQERAVFVQWARAATAADQGEIDALAEAFAANASVPVPQANLTRVVAALDALGIAREVGFDAGHPVLRMGPWTFDLLWRTRWLEAPNPWYDETMQLEAFPDGNVTLRLSAGATNESDYRAIAAQAMTDHHLPVPTDAVVLGKSSLPAARTPHQVSPDEARGCCSHGMPDDLFACDRVAFGAPLVPPPRAPPRAG